VALKDGEKRSDLPAPHAMGKSFFAIRQGKPSGVGTATAFKQLPKPTPFCGG
jgi:hypothetical protein